MNGSKHDQETLPNPCTIKQYEEITGKRLPADSYVMIPSNMAYLGWKIRTYGEALNDELIDIYIVQTAKPAPEVSE